MNNFPAFPVTLLNKHDEEAKDPFGHLVPANGGVTYTGLTALDYFAGEALNGMLANPSSDSYPLLESSMTVICSDAYSVAAVMMEERQKWL